MKNLKILIAGGGIGGITASLCLAERGFDVSLFEKAPAFEETGAGIQLSPNSTRVLHRLGLETALRSTAFEPEATQFKHWHTGKVISTLPLGNEAVEKFGAPYYHIHRSDLLDVLIHAARKRPNIELHTRSSVDRVTQNYPGVRIDTRQGSLDGDLLIGADGIHSLVRASLWGGDRPRYTGNIAWRALVPAECLPHGLISPVATAWLGPGRHFVHYYVRRGELVNCVCVVEKEKQADGDLESWTEPGELNELKSEFVGWHDNIQQLIERMDSKSLFKWALYDRPPMPQWGKDCITLLGDACHPTLPFMAQGAAMAIEDAEVLAACLQQGSEIRTSLLHYEQLRRERTAHVQKGSQRNARLFHLTGVQAWLRNQIMPLASQKLAQNLYNYDTLNTMKRHEQDWQSE